MPDLDDHARAKLDRLEARHLRRSLRTVAREPGAGAAIDGRRLISLSCNDVLGLSRHPDTVRAAIEATRLWGTGAGASRLVTGNNPTLPALEATLARLKGTEAACVFGSGYLASLGVIPALVGPGDLILIDRLAHACLQSGAKLSGADIVDWPHDDTRALASLLEHARTGAHPASRNILIVTETVFSMDGDRASLAEIGALAAEHGAWLMADDAHGLGVLGAGRGGVCEAGAQHLVPLQLGTLSKAAGGYGGYLCASAAVVALMHSRARTFVYATGLPPAQAAAADAALRIIERDPALAARPLAAAARFCARVGLAAPASHIVPILAGDAALALAWQRELEADGFLAVAIRPPTVPEGTSRLRLAFSALLEPHDIDRLADRVRTLLAGRSASAA